METETEEMDDFTVTSPLSPLSVEQNVDMPVEWNMEPPRVSWFRVILLSLRQWPLLIPGLLAAGVQGAIFPSFAIFFSQALETFTYPFNQVSYISSSYIYIL